MGIFKVIRLYFSVARNGLRDSQRLMPIYVLHARPAVSCSPIVTRDNLQNIPNSRDDNHGFLGGGTRKAAYI